MRWFGVQSGCATVVGERLFVMMTHFGEGHSRPACQWSSGLSACDRVMSLVQRWTWVVAAV
jgi:hypothetical protein